MALSSKQNAHNWINVGSSPAKSATFMTKEELLKIVHADRKSYISEVGYREYECLESLVIDGTINDIKGLIEYGVTIPNEIKLTA